MTEDMLVDLLAMLERAPKLRPNPEVRVDGFPPSEIEVHRTTFLPDGKSFYYIAPVELGGGGITMPPTIIAPKGPPWDSFSDDELRAFAAAKWGTWGGADR